MKKYMIILLISAAVMLNAVPVNSFFSDHKSFSVGDVITIIIIEQTSASSSAGSETDKSFDHSLNVDQGAGTLNFIPMMSMGGKASNKASGDASTNRSGKFEGKITARIISIDDNGNLVIKGSRSLKVNGEEEVTSLEGMVRPQDVQADNSVYSYNIAEAKIVYKGKGDVHNGSKVGFLSKIINFIF